MPVPTDRQYTKDHEWVRIADGVATVGVTEYATGALGDAVFLDLPSVGDEVTAEETCGEIESTKSVSDLYSPVSGVVASINTAAVEGPEVVNEDPWGAGWLFTVTVSEPGHLMDAAAYTELTGA